MVPLYIMRSVKTSDLNTLELLEQGMNLSPGIWDHLDCAVVSANCFSFLAGWTVLLSFFRCFRYKPKGKEPSWTAFFPGHFVIHASFQERN